MAKALASYQRMLDPFDTFFETPHLGADEFAQADNFAAHISAEIIDPLAEVVDPLAHFTNTLIVDPDGGHEHYNERNASVKHLQGFIVGHRSCF